MTSPTADTWDERRRNVASNVLSLIESRRLTFRAVARGSGLSVTGLFKIADGESDPTLSSLYKIADFFEIRVDVLLARAGSPASAPLRPAES